MHHWPFINFVVLIVQLITEVVVLYLTVRLFRRITDEHKAKTFIGAAYGIHAMMQKALLEGEGLPRNARLKAYKGIDEMFHEYFSSIGDVVMAGRVKKDMENHPDG